MHRYSKRISAVVGATLLGVAGAATFAISGAAANQSIKQTSFQSIKQTSFQMVRSAAAVGANCLQGAQAKVTIQSQGPLRS